MKATIINVFGGFDMLTMRELAIPYISDNEVLIRVKAIKINPVDVRTRSGGAMAQHLKHHSSLIWV